MLWTNMSLGLLFDPEDGSDVFLQNVVWLSVCYTALWEPEILHNKITLYMQRCFIVEDVLNSEFFHSDKHGIVSVCSSVKMSESVGWFPLNLVCIPLGVPLPLLMRLCVLSCVFVYGGHMDRHQLWPLFLLFELSSFVFRLCWR
jgi:hypothetical protein